MPSEVSVSSHIVSLARDCQVDVEEDLANCLILPVPKEFQSSALDRRLHLSMLYFNSTDSQKSHFILCEERQEARTDKWSRAGRELEGIDGQGSVKSRRKRKRACN